MQRISAYVAIREGRTGAYHERQPRSSNTVVRVLVLMRAPLSHSFQTLDYYTCIYMRIKLAITMDL